MNLRWKAFEKTLGQRVKACDARNRMSRWQRLRHAFNSSITVQGWWFRCVPTAVLAGMALLNTNLIIGHPNAWMIGIGIWGLLVTVTRTDLLWGAARLNPDYRFGWALPLSPDRILHRFMRQVMLGGAFLFLEFLVVYGAVATSAGNPWAAWTGAVACAGLQAGFSLALTFLLVASRLNPEWLFMAAFFFAYVFGSGSLIFKNSPPFASVLQICNPLAWMNGVYWEGWIQGSAGAYWSLMPVALGIVSLSHSLRVVRRLHHQGAFREVGRCSRRLFLCSQPRASALPTDLAAQRRQVLAGDFDQPTPLAQQGFVERFVARFLSPRQRHVVEMLAPSARPWTENFIYVFLYLLPLCLVAQGLIGFETLDRFFETMVYCARSDRRIFSVFLFTGLLVVSMLLGKGLCMLRWPGVWPEWGVETRDRFFSPWRSFRLLPSDYWEVSVTIARTNTVLTLLLVPPVLVILSFWPVCLMAEGTARLTPALLLKALLVVWCYSFVHCSLKLFAFLSGLKHWRSFLKILLACVMFLFLVAGLITSRELWTDALWGSVFISATLLWFLYCGARYRKGLPV